MTPRHEVEAVDANDLPADVLQKFRDSRRTRLLVRDGSDDDIIGVVSLRDLLSEDVTHLRSLVQEVPVIREGLPALNVIEELKASPAHMLLVYDEYGHFEGVVTAMDLLEAIAGDFPEPGDDEPKAVQRDDGSWLIAGWMPADEFAEMIGISLPDDRDYESVAGLVLDRAGILPDVGAHVTVAGWRIEVVDLDGRRIDKLLVSQLAEA